jgi:hypothetical protein
VIITAVKQEQTKVIISIRYTLIAYNLFNMYIDITLLV